MHKHAAEPSFGSPHFVRVNFDILAIRPDSLSLLVSLERLPHVESVAAVVVVVDYSSVD